MKNNQAVRKAFLRLAARLDWTGLAAFCIPLLVYSSTLAPTIYNLDSAEMTTAAATAGITRATGYPLYLLLGYFWAHIPIGDVGYRMNLFSAVWAALTIFLCERILRELRVKPLARLAAAGSLAFSKFFWAMALVAEVYTLQTAIMAAILLALLRWSAKPAPLRLGLVGLSIGLGLSHHLATALLLPGIAFFLLANISSKDMGWKALAAGGVGLAAGLSFYLYLPLRYLAAPAFNYAGAYDEMGIFHPANLLSISDLWWLVTGRSFSVLMFAYPLSGVWQEFQRFWVYLSGTFLAIGIGPGLLGLGYLLKCRLKTGVFLLLLFLGHIVFYINYRVLDKDLMFLPAYLIWALWLGAGYSLLLDWLGHSTSSIQSPASRSSRAGKVVLSGVMIGMVILALAWNWRLVDLSQDFSTRQRGEAILASLAPGALVFGYWDTVPVIQYLQLVEGQRPDIQAISRFQISPEVMIRLITLEITQRPVYIDSIPPDLPGNLAYNKIKGPIF